MEEFVGKLVVAMSGGYLYEGRHQGFVSRGPFEFHKLVDVRFINAQDCRPDSEGVVRPKAGEDQFSLPDPVFLPVAGTAIHPTHLHDRK